MAGEFNYSDTPVFAEARTISKFAQKLFLDEEVDQVEVLFTNFVSTLTQHPDRRTILPVGEITAVESDVSGENKPEELDIESVEYLFEPGADQVLGALLPHYLNYIVYQLLLETKASEHSARMVAMKSATDNAQSMIEDLT